MFVRSCMRGEPSQATLWEISRGNAVSVPPDDDLDEFSASADGSRIAFGIWRNGKRIIKVYEGSVLLPR